MMLTLAYRKILYYISTMMALYKNSRTVGDKDALQHKLPGVPTIILDGLTSRFTEKERSTNKFVLFPYEYLCATTLTTPLDQT